MSFYLHNLSVVVFFFKWKQRIQLMYLSFSSFINKTTQSRSTRTTIANMVDTAILFPGEPFFIKRAGIQENDPGISIYWLDKKYKSKNWFINT